MNFKTKILILTVLMISVLSMQTIAFNYEVENIDNTNRINKAQTALFKLTVENNFNNNDYFTISTRDTGWILNVDPADKNIKAGETKEFTIKLNPKESLAESKIYFVPIKIKAEEKGMFFEEKERFAIYLASPQETPGEYNPTITPSVYIDKTVDPREKVSVRTTIRNRNARDYDELRVVLDGEAFSKEYTTSLMPLEEKKNDVLFEISPLTQPGRKTVTLSVYLGDQKVGESKAEYELLGYTNLNENVQADSFLFRTEKVYTYENTGNDMATAKKQINMNFFQRMFSSFEPKLTKEKNSEGKTVYVLEKEVSSNEKVELRAVTDYRLLVIAIILIIIGVTLYYQLRSPLVIMKTAEPLGKTKDGVREMKIRLYLKNRSRKQVSAIKIIDHVPKIADVEKKTGLGSVEPISINKIRKGTSVRWELENIEPFEERIITYKVNSKLKLVGGIKLPSSKVRFESKAGKTRNVFSNEINLSYQQKEE
jgi:hypothetical protein